MKAKKKFLLLLMMLFSVPSLFAGTKDIVLQNGLNEYNGCEETYFTNTDPTGVYGEFTNMTLDYEKCAT
jgi:hypothetical protein